MDGPDSLDRSKVSHRCAAWGKSRLIKPLLSAKKIRPVKLFMLGHLVGTDAAGMGLLLVSDK